MEHVACDLCGGHEVEPSYTISDRISGGGQFAVVRCRACGLAYVDPRPTEQEIGRYYPDAYVSYRPVTGFRRWIKERILDTEVRRMRRILPADPAVLDVGAGVGEEAAFLRDLGSWRVEATDISAFAGRQARQLFGIAMHVGSLESLGLPDAHYDYVRMHYVLSHVHSPRRLLVEAYRILKPGGAVVLWVPNFDSLARRIFGGYWEGQEPPRHLYHFTPRTLSRYLVDAGFEDIRIHYSAVPNTFIHSMRNVAVVAGMPRSVVRLLTLNPVMLVIFSPLALIAALLHKSDRITVYARRSLS